MSGVVVSFLCGFAFIFGMMAATLLCCLIVAAVFFSLFTSTHLATDNEQSSHDHKKCACGGYHSNVPSNTSRTASQESDRLLFTPCPLLSPQSSQRLTATSRQSLPYESTSSSQATGRSATATGDSRSFKLHVEPQRFNPSSTIDTSTHDCEDTLVLKTHDQTIMQSPIHETPPQRRSRMPDTAIRHRSSSPAPWLVSAAYKPRPPSAITQAPTMELTPCGTGVIAFESGSEAYFSDEERAALSGRRIAARKARDAKAKLKAKEMSMAL